ncbi:nucleolar transcription factor 1-like isoform X2 [Phyllopteryx taeniolatus]|uniref:nucleolar transcription factor 1-like isoform X2 n=1 Tax=Phyllopteryx taeniolatus TaxID=161469 RepID=UPI002AD34D8D|nr:nucleolar transcription factor 1-like isoform X2 [Phyllopteryx taeniolatus]
MDTEWTNENILKLLNAMKTNITGRDRIRTCYDGVKTLDWEKVAFPPFSPKDCQQRWKIVSYKIRKIRTLTELVDEVADKFSDSPKNQDARRPKKPSLPPIIFYQENRYKYQEQHPELNRQKLFSLVMDKYGALTDDEKALYRKKYQCALAEYRRLRPVSADGDQGMQEKRKCRSKKTPKGMQEKRKCRSKKTPKAMQEKRKCRSKKTPKAMQKKRKRLSKETPEAESELSSDESTEEHRPIRPPLSGYTLFIKELRLPKGSALKRHWLLPVAECWRKLNDEEKERLAERCMKMKSDYAEKKKSYLLNRKERRTNVYKSKDTRPSDSEDEDVEVSSAEEEEQYLDSNEDVDEDDSGEIFFDMF